MPTELVGLPLRELLALHLRVLREISDRGLTRTRGSLVGELGERIALASYGGSLSIAGRKSVDLVDKDGRALQVKTRALDPGVNRIFAFSSFDFDLLVAIMLDATTFEIQWARELTNDAAREIARFRTPSQDWAIATSKVWRSGRDITGALRQAYDSLGVQERASESSRP